MTKKKLFNALVEKHSLLMEKEWGNNVETPKTMMHPPI